MRRPPRSRPRQPNMAELPTFRQLDLWARREAEVLTVTMAGLRALAAEPPRHDDEDTLNWALAHHIRRAILDRRRAGTASIDPPALEPKSLSVAGGLAAGPAPRDRKRPDLVWQWVDEHATGDERPFLELVIECKRLGRGDLCRLYVANGVARFVNDEHAYAKHMRSGFMVGYLQDMSIVQAEQRVGKALDNQHLAALDHPTLRDATFGQRLRRPYPVDPFCLHHLWQAVPNHPPGVRTRQRQ